MELGLIPMILWKLYQIPAKVIECLTWISFAGIHGFIMESDLMALRHSFIFDNSIFDNNPI